MSLTPINIPMSSPVALNNWPFSATPAFYFSPGDQRTFKMLLTGDVTSSTLDTSNLSPGSHVKFILVQDAVGGHAFAWPPNCLGAQPIAQQPGATTVQSFIADDKGNLLSHGVPAMF